MIKKEKKFFRETEPKPNFLHITDNIHDTMLNYSVCTETGKYDPFPIKTKGR